MHKDIIGGVSPLKKVVKAKRSGKYGKEATSTEKRRGGFSEVTGSTNRGGYNVQTRFKVDPWVKPASGGDRTPTKPYSYDPDGKMQVNTNTDANASASASATAGTAAEGKWVQDGKNLPSYRKAWDGNLDNVQKSYKTFEDYVDDIEGQKKMAETEDWEGLAKKKGVSVEEAKKTWSRRKNKEGQWRWVETKAATKGSSSASSSASSKIN